MIAGKGLAPRAVRRDIVVLEQHIREGRFQRAMAVIAGLASLMSGYQVLTEHYRAGFGLQVMYTPLLLSPALFIGGLGAAASRRLARTLLPIASVLILVDGLAGFYYHVREIARRPGGWRLPVVNVVMGAPLFAPILFALSGYLGLIASLLRRWDGSSSDVLPPAWLRVLPLGIEHEVVEFRQEVREGRFQRHFAAAAGLVGLLSGFEAAYSHYEDAFSKTSEWYPVVAGPLMALAGLGTVVSRTAAKTLLPLASIVAIITGGLGFYYHARQIVKPSARPFLMHRLFYAPPPLAPLLLAASGGMGLIAALLRRES